MFYSHIGWLLVRQSPALWGEVDISDIVNDPVAVWQRRYYLVLAFFVPPGIPRRGRSHRLERLAGRICLRGRIEDPDLLELRFLRQFRGPLCWLPAVLGSAHTAGLAIHGPDHPRRRLP